MPAGRPPIPTKLHILHGNPGKRQLNEYEPQPEEIAPDCPGHLNEDARAEWARLSEELSALGLLTRLDRAVMTAYCQAVADYLEAQRHLDAEPKIYKTETGYPVMTPWKAVQIQALEQMRKFGTELGLSPASRSRIAVKTTKSKKLEGAKRFLA